MDQPTDPVPEPSWVYPAAGVDEYVASTQAELSALREEVARLRAATGRAAGAGITEVSVLTAEVLSAAQQEAADVLGAASVAVDRLFEAAQARLASMFADPDASFSKESEPEGALFAHDHQAARDPSGGTRGFDAARFTQLRQVLRP